MSHKTKANKRKRYKEDPQWRADVLAKVAAYDKKYKAYPEYKALLYQRKKLSRLRTAHAFYEAKLATLDKRITRTATEVVKAGFKWANRRAALKRS